MKASVSHNDRQIADLNLRYAGRTNVFSGEFELGLVEKDYEVLSILVTAAEAATANLGAHRVNVKLAP